MLSSHIWPLIAQYGAALQSLLGHGQPEQRPYFPEFAFGEQWLVLGPFQIGTREVAWGADPLEYHGGFRSLQYNENSTFKSSLAFNATVSWSTTNAQLSDPDTEYASADLSVMFPDIGWAFLQQVYGWSALQRQDWARGEIIVQPDPQQKPTKKTLAFHARGVLEYWIDETHYWGGDFYGYGRAPLVLHLNPGVHRIDIRLVRDVRAHGGITDVPSIDVKLELENARPGLSQGSDVLLADVLNDETGPLASPYMSVILRNDMEMDHAFITRVSATHNLCEAMLVKNESITIAPGQSRPVAFKVGCIPGTSWQGEIELAFGYEQATVNGSGDTKPEKRVLEVSAFPWVPKSIYEPHKITFMHPGGIVSYAILRPPSQNALCADTGPDVKLPIFIGLHGAGLEADNDMVAHALDPLPDLCAWVLFPTGVTPWSGDDWHTWGFADFEAAVAAIPKWIEHVEWTGPGVDIERWLVAGHSNGGQGTWYALTHRPDKVIAAAPVSGYSSIQNYVPYTFWHNADPGKKAILEASLSSYKHELLLENAKGIPVLQQHGSEDDNVPAYHSRLLNQLAQQAGAESDYVEMPGKPHWWNGVMTTYPLSAFFERHLSAHTAAQNVPVNLRNFTLVVANPANFGPKHGVEVLLLATPGQLGKIELIHDPLTLACAFTTNNIRAFRIPRYFSECSAVSVDNVAFTMEAANVFSKDGFVTLWKEPSTLVWTCLSEMALQSFPPSWMRWGRQLGGIDSILRSNGTIQIASGGKHLETDRVALQMSRNLCQYFGADTEMQEYHESEHHGDATDESGNIITVVIGESPPRSLLNVDHAIQHPAKDRLYVVGPHGELHGYHTSNGMYGLVAIYLRPLPNERLELVVWGADKESLEVAARLVPMMTGTGQPDFVIADRRMLWKGLEGALALGFFDEMWNVSMSAHLG